MIKAIGFQLEANVAQAEDDQNEIVVDGRKRFFDEPHRN